MPIYSHSRLEAYQNCPLQYKFQYVDRLKRREKGIEAFLGSCVHEALEKLYRDLLNGKRNDLAELLSYFQNQWDKYLDENTVRIVRKEYTPEHYRIAGRECIRKYYARHSPFDGDITLGVERRLNFSLDREGRFRMRGFVDRLARTKEGIWEIHDYKTSGSLPTQKEVDANPQLALYQIGLQQEWPDVKRVRLVWHYLRHDTELSSTWTTPQLAELQQDTRKLIGKIEADQKFTPRESSRCDWCEFLDLCPLKKHPLKISALAPEDFRTEDGVRLVDQYVALQEEQAALKDQNREIETLIKKVKEQLIAYARQEEMQVIAGSDYLANVRLQKKFKFPESREKRRQLLEDLLRKADKWDEVSILNTNSLNKILSENQWDSDLTKKIKQFAIEKEDNRVYLRKRRDEK